MDLDKYPGKMAPPTLMTIRETANTLRCCEKTVRRRIEAGELRIVRNGRRVLVPAAAIDEFLGEGVWR